MVEHKTIKNGFTLTETLVSLAIFGLLLMLSGKVMVSFLQPGVFFRESAYLAAKYEMETSIALNVSTDSSYFLENQNVRLFREIEVKDSIKYYRVTVLYMPDSIKLTGLEYYDIPSE